MAIVAAPNSNLPQEILDLRAQLSSSDFTVRLDAAAAVVGMPRYSDIPRPGAASSWDITDWLSWGKPWGFIRLDDSGDCVRMGHPDFHNLIFSRSKSSKEYRAAMNAAGDFRRDYSVLLETCAVIVIGVVDAVLSGSEWKGKRLDLGPNAAVALSALRQITRDGQTRKLASTNNDAVSNADREAWASLPKVLKVLDSEFGISARAALTQIGLGASAENMAWAIKNSSKCPPVAALLLTELRSLLEIQREIRKQQTDAKAAERAAIRNQREGKRDPGSQIKYDNDIKQARAQLRTGFASARTMAESMLKLIDRQMNYVEEVPLPAYPGAPVELTEQRDAACAERDTMELERDALKERVESDRTIINRLEGRVMELEKGTTTGCPLSRQSVEDLLTTVLTKLNTTDIGQILSGIKECRAQAAALKAILYAANPTNPTSPPVPV